MRFLIIVKNKFPLPPDAAAAIFDAMIGWIDGNTKNGKMEQAWGFAGVQAGGGILSVESLQELDAIMTEMPFGPFSKVEVHGLTDAKEALTHGKEVVSMMTKGR
ncbi:MAG: muconolactone Delta-isomerase family protein [Actinobacteria bacterium]|nr:muconolactone Delta-isomerase family protein [Actinomycetota bacterium]